MIKDKHHNNHHHYYLRIYAAHIAKRTHIVGALH